MAKTTKKFPEIYTCKHLMLCEGYSDIQFLLAVLKFLKVQEENWPHIKDTDGKSNLKSKENFENLKKIIQENSNLKTVSVFIDADEYVKETITAIQNVAISEWQREISEGQWLGEAPKLGLFVFPDGQTEGELETLIWNAMPEEEKFKIMKGHVTTYLDEMKKLGWPYQSEFKAKLSTFLAAAWDDDPRAGPAAREKKIDFAWPGFKRLLDFLRPLSETTGH